MSYLALNPSPLNENENEGNYKRQLRNTNNKTIKKKAPTPKIASNVQNMMQTVGYSSGEHNFDAMDDSNGDEPADFNPPDYAELTKLPNNNNAAQQALPPMMANTMPNMMMNTAKNVPAMKEPFNNGLTYANLPNNSSYENNDVYVRPFVPYYTNQMTDANEKKNKDPLIEKLNYMILLLEEQQNDRTDHITEELILYFFLGIFMIFMVDSFARSGKYVR